MAERKDLTLKTTIASLCLGICISGASASAQQPQTFGTTATSYISIGAGALLPQDSTTTFLKNYYLTASAGSFWLYPSLPSGAVLQSIALDFCDDDGGIGPYLGFGFLDRFGNEQSAGVISGQSYPAGCFTETLSGFAPVVIDNTTNRLAILVEPVGTQKFTGLVFGYQLQVSPAPATATFPDVPTSDFGFQYIEALVASGITGGCGGGNYCPDQPVTRRQMAIFLAKALGLQWQ